MSTTKTSKLSIMEQSLKSKTSGELRVIKTARSLEDINVAIEDGFHTVVKKVEPNLAKIKSKYAVVKNKSTGKIEVLGDMRSAGSKLMNKEYELVIDWTDYYPYSFESPFAAYMVPKDIEIGEHVILEDLIEDFVGSEWNGRHFYRLDSCEAVWNGKDFDILYDEGKDISIIMG